MRRENGRKYFYQWELNQRLIVDEACTIVHFANGTTEKTLSCEVIKEGEGEGKVRLVNVPNILLQTPAELHAYAWDGASVVAHTVFSLVARPKPAEYVYTETEVKQYDLQEAELRALVGKINDQEQQINALQTRQAEQAAAQAQQINELQTRQEAQSSIQSQGRSAKYSFTSPGWKRVLNIIRTSGGVVNFGISNADPLYMSQAAGICFGGFVEYKEDSSGLGQPMLYQLYDNVFGSDYGTGHPVRITAVRIGYPDPAQEPYDNGTSGDARVNPINCYLDVKVEYDEAVLESGTISFNVNYAGFADSHNCVPITVETNATDTGMYGESLLFHELYLRDGAMLYVPYGMADLPGYIKAGDGTKTIGIPGLSTGQYGFKTNSTGTTLLPAMATNGEIEAGTNQYKPIVPSNLEYAVRYVGDNVYLEKPYTEPEIGKILKVLSVNEDGTFTCTWGDAPVAGVSDVQIGANSIVTDGVAKMRVSSSYGTSVVNNNMLATYPADNTNISNRGAKYMPITTTNFDYTVKSAMCDGKGAAWTSDEQTAAQKRMGVDHVGRKLDVLWKLNEGISYDFVTDATKAYEKTVPEGGKYGAVEAIGGDTEVIDGEIVNADVESVMYNDSVIGVIPTTVRSLAGYGWSAINACNAIERTESGWQYVQRVGSVDLGSLTWKYNATRSLFYSTGIAGSVLGVGYSVKANCICVPYTTLSASSQDNNVTDKSISIGYVIESKAINIRDTDYTDAAAFKAAMGGVMLYYELAEPIITDITDSMADFPQIIDVEANGTITFENAASLPVPNTLKYLRSLKEVSA